jgi:CheY-like chemotaxis protein
VADVVLVADGDRARAARVVAACGARGLETRHVETGAAALEAALADAPHLIVASVELPLIDGPRLAEILRANPRTADARCLFLGRLAGRPASPFDEVLPAAAHAEEIAAQVAAMLARQTRMDAMRKESAARREVEGQLAQIPLPDLIQLLHGGRRTGVIELVRARPDGSRETGAVWLRDGNVVHATAAPHVVAEKALFRLLAWRDGHFTFTSDATTKTATISAPTRVLLLEGMRQLDEAEQARGALPSLSACVRLAVPKSEIPHAVHPVTQEVLLLLEMYERVGDVVDHCGHPDYQVLRTLATLVERGLLTLGRGAAAEAPRGTPWFEPAALERLHDWLQAGRPGRAPKSAKLLVAASEREATRELMRLLAALPGLEPGEEEGAGLGTDGLASLGRLRLAEGLHLELIQVPTGPDFAPLWPVLAHRALGTLLVHTHPVPEAEARLEPLVHALSRLPDARLFRVLLLRKGERVATDEMQQRLGLLDRSSLFLLPLESGKDSRALLAALISRVLP